ncbi:MAG TPA: hypothetical protein VG798_00205 [Rhizomicrobium sp.]|nr:hypothetical protein [Rhizomicrobium sp.]
MGRGAAIFGVVLAGVVAQGANAQSSQRVPLPPGVILKNVSLSWEGRKLIFHALFNQYGHEMPIYLQWRSAKGDSGIAEIDTIEQFGRDMPLEVTLISLERSPAGQAIVYMGHPAPNTPRLDGNDAVNLTGRLLMTNDDVGSTDEYGFSLSSDGAAMPRISAVK